jgi:hypothetical protein
VVAPKRGTRFAAVPSTPCAVVRLGGLRRIGTTVQHALMRPQEDAMTPADDRPASIRAATSRFLPMRYQIKASMVS